MTTRHEFLAQLHELLQPNVYLEIGVQHGWSLQLSKAPISIGIDPEIIVSAKNVPNAKLVHSTSDEYFEDDGRVSADVHEGIDLAFIDGMHLAEFAWRDFLNVAKYCHAGSVVVFDDVLPYTQEMAEREICPGDWTGDVWKVFAAIRQFPWLACQVVDTSPTGTLVVTGFDRKFPYQEDDLRPRADAEVPTYVFDRRHAWSAPAVIENLKDRGFGK